MPGSFTNYSVLIVVQLPGGQMLSAGTAEDRTLMSDVATYESVLSLPRAEH